MALSPSEYDVMLRCEARTSIASFVPQRVDRIEPRAAKRQGRSQNTMPIRAEKPTANAITATLGAQREWPVPSRPHRQARAPE